MHAVQFFSSFLNFVCYFLINVLYAHVGLSSFPGPAHGLVEREVAPCCRFGSCFQRDGLKQQEELVPREAFRES